MLCDWCDEPIVEETGDYELVYRRRYAKTTGVKPVPIGQGWDESYYHDYCLKDGTRGEDVRKNEQGELEIL